MSDDLKYLWAPWRMGYIQTAKNEFGPCLFCDKANIGKDEDDLVVHRGENAYILMNLYPYNNGHLMITPYEHEKKFDGLKFLIQHKKHFPNMLIFLIIYLHNLFDQSTSSVGILVSFFFFVALRLEKPPFTIRLKEPHQSDFS